MDKTTEIGIVKIEQINTLDRMREDYGDKTEWEDFKNDIREHGLYSAIAVRKTSPTSYELLAGGRRLKACTELGHTSINATIYTGSIDSLDMGIIELNENLKRKNLAPLEECHAKAKLVELMEQKFGKKRSKSDTKGVSLRDVAKMIGESHANLSRDVNISKAMGAIPGLEKTKTKAEAFSLVKKGVKDFVETKRVKKIVEEQKSQPASMNSPDRWYIIGDALEGTKKAKSGTVDLIEIDPPYGISLKDMKKVSTEAGKSSEEYNEISAPDYPIFMKTLLQNCFELLKDNGWLVLWFGPEPWFEDMYTWATDCGFIGRRIPAIWNKSTGQTMQPNLYLANSYEMFFYFRKSKEAKINKPGRSNIFDYKPVHPNHKSHPTERPIELMQEVIETFVGKGRIVCSPFAGSGNTLLAAANLNCLTYGWDLTEKYKEKFILKAHSASIGDYRSYV